MLSARVPDMDYGVIEMLLRALRMKTFFLLLLALFCLSPVTAIAQGEREVTLLAELGQELVERREAQARAAAEAEHQRLLEEKTKLLAAYKRYLGQARRTALELMKSKASVAAQADIDKLRAQARTIIDEVQGPTKQRIPTELDPVFATLEAAVALTPNQLHTADPKLAALGQSISSKGRLQWLDRIAIMYAMCKSADHAAVIASNVRYREELSGDEAMAIDDCNYRRLVLGLQPVAIDMGLVKCGRDHSSDMISRGFFAHVSPIPGKEAFTDRAKLFGTTAGGENIAAGYRDGLAVTYGWWTSPGHLKNMMGKGWKRIGVGQEQKHYTQMFGR